jgi:hypothetical protein
MAPPFAFTWRTPLRGSYDLTARAMLADGSALAAPVVPVTVVDDYTSAMLIAAGSTWKYWDAGTLPAANWHANLFNDAAWPSGAARLGFGGDGEVTALQYGGVGADGRFHSRLAYYFRRTFTLPAGATFSQVVLKYQRDDGIIIYVNGTEVLRNNMPGGAVSATTPASGNATDETAWLRATVAPARLRSGSNVVAAEVHQQSDTSSDLGFDLELAGFGVNAAAIANTPPPAAPLISLGAAGGGTDLEFRLEDPASGRLYLIECSEDLFEWAPFHYEVIGGSGLGVTVQPEAPARFYRARWLPVLP